MIKHFHYLSCIVLSVFVLCGCSSDEDERKEVTAFQKNAKEASDYLKRITHSADSGSFKNSSTYERFKIVHISDPHLSAWTADNYYTSPKNLKEAVAFANIDSLKINMMVATGDFISNNDETNSSDAAAYMKAFISFLFEGSNVPSFVCTGNHDANMLTENTGFYLSKQTLNSLLFAKTNHPLHQPSGENYYYADLSNPSGGTIRIIALDNTDQDGFQYNTMLKSCITKAQVDWLINTALTEGMTANHHVIILNHHPLQPFSRDLSTYMCSGTHLYSEKMVPDIVNAFIKKETLSRKYEMTCPPYEKLSVEADFTNTPGEFVAYMGGHAHTPAHFEVECSDSLQAKQIMLLANTLSPDLQNNNYTRIERKSGSGSMSSNSFSIYAVDTQEKNIYITCFGAKSSSSPTIETVSYR